MHIKTILTDNGSQPCGPPSLAGALDDQPAALEEQLYLERRETRRVLGGERDWQIFGGMDQYEPRLPCDQTKIGRFSRLLGEDSIEPLLKATIECAVDIKAVKPADFARLIIDSTVQSKAITYPVDSRLLEIARRNVGATKRTGLSLKQIYMQKGKTLRRKDGGDACERSQSIISI